jgi:hypothetical protein
MLALESTHARARAHTHTHTHTHTASGVVPHGESDEGQEWSSTPIRQYSGLPVGRLWRPPWSTGT